MINISQIAIGDGIEGETFLVSEANTKSNRNGSLMINLTLRNATGRIPAVIFGCPLQLTGGEVVRVSGEVGHFNGLQVTVRDIEALPAAEAEALMKELLPRRIPEKTIRESVSALIDTIEDAAIRQFVSQVIDFNDRFFSSPGAKSLHHSYTGGLCEHSVAVASIVNMSALLYTRINVDIAVAGALLHDIGKIRELSFAGGLQYTDEGRMLNHTYLGAEIVSDHAKEYRTLINDQTLRAIVHIILSHHGQPEFGALVKPATLEAEIVALADKMDSSMINLSELIRNDSNAGGWTAYDPKLARCMRKPARPIVVSEQPEEEFVAAEKDTSDLEPF